LTASLTVCWQAADVTVERHISSYFFAIARNIAAAGNALAIIDPTNGKANLSDGVIWRPFVRGYIMSWRLSRHLISHLGKRRRVFSI
jgi:hypothetical protein